MSVSRPFSYNPGATAAIPGTEQVGNLSIGTPSSGFSATGLEWWNGPDEELGYVIACQVPTDTQPTPVAGVSGSVGFFRSEFLTESSFITISGVVAGPSGGGPFSSGSDAKTWLNSNGYWTSYELGPITTGLILNWDIQNSSSYSGTGTTITDLQGNVNGAITGTITYTSGSPNYLTIEGGVSEYIYTGNLNPYLSPVNTGTAQSVFLWIYPTSNGVIYSEQGQLSPDGGWYDAQIQRNAAGNFLFGVWPYSIGTPLITSTLTYPLNNWYYVGWTYSGTSLRAFVNGVSAGLATVTRQTPYNNGGNLPMYFNLGYPTATDLGTTSNSTYRLGAMHVYNIGLTAGDVTTNFNNTKSFYGL